MKKGFVGGFTGQPGLMAGWVPGQDPVIYPENSGILIEPGDALGAADPLPLRHHAGPRPQHGVAPAHAGHRRRSRSSTSSTRSRRSRSPACPGVVAPLCDRNAAIADDSRLYGPAAASIEAGLLLLCGKTSEQLAATFKDGVAHTTCDYQVPDDGTIVGVLGHMHTLGKSFRLTLDPGTPKQKILLDIPRGTSTGR